MWGEEEASSSWKQLPIQRLLLARTRQFGSRDKKVGGLSGCSGPIGIAMPGSWIEPFLFLEGWGRVKQ